MAWDDDKSTAADPNNPAPNEQLTADEWDAHVTEGHFPSDELNLGVDGNGDPVITDPQNGGQTVMRYERSSGAWVVNGLKANSASISWPAGATAFKTSDQTGLTSGVTTQITFDDTRGDVNGNWDLANDKYVFPEDGDYEITYSIEINNPGTGTINTFASINAGTALGENRSFSTQPYSNFTSQASTVKQGIASGDELTLSIFTTNTLDVSSNNFVTFVTITKVA